MSPNRLFPCSMCRVEHLGAALEPAVTPEGEPHPLYRLLCEDCASELVHEDHSEQTEFCTCDHCHRARGNAHRRQLAREAATCGGFHPAALVLLGDALLTALEDPNWPAKE